MLRMPFEQQRAVFRKLPVDFAAELVAHFPYYHAYVLLHSRPLPELSAIVDAMKPADRDHFLDDLAGRSLEIPDGRTCRGRHICRQRAAVEAAPAGDEAPAAG